MQLMCDLLGENSNTNTTFINWKNQPFVKGSHCRERKTLHVEERGRRKKLSPGIQPDHAHSSRSACRPEVIFFSFTEVSETNRRAEEKRRRPTASFGSQETGQIKESKMETDRGHTTRTLPLLH